jgi:hypothetical protein
MFFEVAAGVAIGAFAVWQWIANRPPAASRRALPAARIDPFAEARETARETMRRRMVECGANDADLLFTNSWTAQYLGDTLTLRDRMIQLQQQMPVATWPAEAQRIWCAFAAPLQFTPVPYYPPPSGHDRHNRP